jgi:hypothetical protein
MGFARGALQTFRLLAAQKTETQPISRANEIGCAKKIRLSLP